jgi:hypothetical protein
VFLLVVAFDNTLFSLKIDVWLLLTAHIIASLIPIDCQSKSGLYVFSTRALSAPGSSVYK